MKIRQNITILCISLAVLIFPLVFFQHIKADTVNSYVSFNKPTVIIDGGHGGKDGGAVSVTGTLEKDINLSIAHKLERLLNANGFDTLMTRTTDNEVSDNEEIKKHDELKNRVDIFNSSADNIVISIHQNKFTQEQYSGTQIFYSQNNSKSEILAENIKNSVVSLIQNDNKRECKKAGSEIFILDNSNVPTVLVECGFLSNYQEANSLDSEEYQNKLTYCIFLGIQEFENTLLRNDINGKN